MSINNFSEGLSTGLYELDPHNNIISTIFLTKEGAKRDSRMIIGHYPPLYIEGFFSMLCSGQTRLSLHVC